MKIRSMIARRSQDESGMALAATIILLTIMAGLVATMSLVTVSSLKNSSATRDATFFDLATNTAVSDALRMANDPKSGEDIANHIGSSNAVSGGTDNSNVNWQWYLRVIDASYAGLAYDIVATGYRGSATDPVDSRVIIARLTSFPTDGARWVGDSVFYRPTKSSVYSWGVFGANGITVSGYTQVAAFDSLTGTQTTGSTIGSNESVSISSTSTVDRIMMMNSYPGHAAGDRCTSALCDSTHVVDAKYGVDLSVTNEWIAAACPNPAASYPTVNGSTITINATGPNCFNNVTLSGNVTVTPVNGSPSSGRPAEVYVLGNLVVVPGAHFNNSGDNAVTGAMIYHMYVGGATVSIGANGAPGSGTDFRALIAGSATTACSVGQPSSTTTFKGALVCGSVLSSGTTDIFWDEQTGSITGDRNETSRIWDISGYRNQS